MQETTLDSIDKTPHHEPFVKLDLPMRKRFDRDGCAIIPNVFASQAVDGMIQAIDVARSNDAARRRRDDVYAMRNIHRIVPLLTSATIMDRLRAIATELLGKRAFLTRSLFFDKPPAANWSIRWHQDVTIACKERRDTPGFGPWSVKAGIPHVRATSAVLEGMVALRVHLDDCDESNGALIVIPAGHQHGRLTTHQLTSLREASSPITLACARGDVIAMRPLLPHASRPATSPEHRRVIHFEFASDNLPLDLEWDDRV